MPAVDRTGFTGAVLSARGPLNPATDRSLCAGWPLFAGPNRPTGCVGTGVKLRINANQATTEGKH